MIYCKLNDFIGRSVYNQIDSLNEAVDSGRPVRDAELLKLSDDIRTCESLSDIAEDSYYNIEYMKASFNELYYRTLALNEGIGFENPFDCGDTYEVPDVDLSDNDVEIKNVAVYKHRPVNGNIAYRDGRMYSTDHFSKGNVLDVCSYDILDDADMYSPTVRRLSFELTQPGDERRTFGLPHGNINSYRNSVDACVDGNAEYSIDTAKKIIIIKATGKIRPNDEIILVACPEDFENEIKPGMFNPENTKKSYTETKNFKIL